jgi:hypothetical protein
MTINERVKDTLKKFPVIYKLGTKYRYIQQSSRIKREQAYYERKASSLCISGNVTEKAIISQIREKLAQRNIRTRAKDKDSLNIIYATGPCPWDLKNIAPAIRKYGNLTVYNCVKYGFDCNKPDWLWERDKLNGHFLKFIKTMHEENSIDIVLTYLSGSHLYSETIDSINNMGIVTVSFHLDDRLSFRGEIEGGRWTGPADVCKAYDLNLTQAPESLIKYYAEGGNALLWPLAANQELYYPRKIPFKHDVSFLGSAHGNRKPFIAYLRKNGINVETFGKGWSNGFIPDEKVPEIFSSSRINLNFGDIAFTNYQCGKCRDFEIPMSGGLMLTTHNPHLANYFELDKEIFTFKNKEECVSQIHRLLSNPKLCEIARQKARERAFNEHTWEHRVESLLRTIGYLE